jgi:hypothetical protein
MFLSCLVLFFFFSKKSELPARTRQCDSLHAHPPVTWRPAQEPALKRMLELGADVADADYRRRSALHYVAVLGNVRLAGVVLMHVAVLEHCDELLRARDDR